MIALLKKKDLVPGSGKPRYQWPPPLPGSFRCCGGFEGENSKSGGLPSLAGNGNTAVVP